MPGMTETHRYGRGSGLRWKEDTPDMVLLIIFIALTILGALGYLEQLLGFKWRGKTLVFLLICYILLSGGQQLIQWYAEEVKDVEIKQLKDGTEILGRSLQTTEQSLHSSQQEVNELKKRELLRPWAMIVPTGEIASDVYGTNLERSSTRSKRHQEIFIREGSSISFDLNQCPNQEYRDKIKMLITDYPYIPYAYVAFSRCLKIIDDPSWKQEAERAKELLEKLIEVKPHVIVIDGYYMFLMGKVLETTIEENRFWDRGEMGEYRPKGMPY